MPFLDDGLSIIFLSNKISPWLGFIKPEINCFFIMKSIIRIPINLVKINFKFFPNKINNCKSKKDLKFIIQYFSLFLFFTYGILKLRKRK